MTSPKNVSVRVGGYCKNRLAFNNFNLSLHVFAFETQNMNSFHREMLLTAVHR